MPHQQLHRGDNGGAGERLNISGNATGNALAAATTLTVQGGSTFQMTGDNVGGTDIQTVAGTTVSNGGGNISLVQNGAASVALTLGTLTHSAASTINFSQSSTGTVQFAKTDNRHRRRLDQ